MVRRSTRTRYEYLRSPAGRRRFDEAATALGARLRRRREHLALTQEEASERIGIHPTTLREIEAGRANVMLVVLIAVADAYEIELHNLFPRPRR